MLNPYLNCTEVSCRQQALKEYDKHQPRANIEDDDLAKKLSQRTQVFHSGVVLQTN